MDYRVCYHAARDGNLKILKWARENGIPWGYFTYNIVAFHTKMEILNFLSENNCPYNRDICTIAACNNDLELLKWARANGCPWDYRVYAYANHRKHTELVNWAVENGCPDIGDEIPEIGGEIIRFYRNAIISPNNHTF